MPRHLALVSLLALSSSAGGEILGSFSAGTGGSSATIQVDFANGNGYLFDWHFSGESTSGWAALSGLAASLDELTIQADDFGWGAFLTGVGVNADWDYGTGDQWPIENYWHYWVKDTGEWEQSWVGASDRILENGDSDAWVFGSSTLPQGVPAPGALVVLAVALRAVPRRYRAADSFGGNLSRT